MPPNEEELRCFVDGLLNEDDRRRIADHLTMCPLCREFCEEYRELLADLEATAEDAPPEAVSELAAGLHRQAVRGLIVPLRRLSETESEAPVRLAADAVPPERSGVESLATLYSEDPEIVLLLMRDHDHGRDYLQLVTEDPEIAAHALIRAPELEREFVTDTGGRAEVVDLPDRAWETSSWQIKMPDAVFEMEPLVYDPDRTEHATSAVLTSDQDDRVEISLERKTEGKLLSVRVLQLDGRADFGPLRVDVSQGRDGQLRRLGPDEAVVFELSDPEAGISIRLYE